MAISPGRSASQTAPAAARPARTRNATTRIMFASRPSWRGLGERVDGGLGEAPRSRQRSNLHLGLADPALRGRARSVGQARDFGQRTRDIAVRRLYLGARHDGARIV